MLVMTLRTLILYVVVLVVVRIMGKRELGQLQPFEFVVAILIADLVSVPMSDTGVPIFYGVIPVLTLLVAHLIISQISLKNIRFRNLISGNPTIVISQGIIDQSALAKQRYNLDDLLEQLREKNIFCVASVEYAILETSGRLSVMLKDKKRPPIVEDMDIDIKNVIMPKNVIMDGEIIETELEESGLSRDELSNKLKNIGYRRISDVFICTVYKDKDIYVQPMEENRRK